MATERERQRWYFGKMDYAENGKQRRRNTEACRQAATERWGEFILWKGGGGGVAVVDSGRLGYMTFVSMVMVSPSPTRREMVL